VTTLNAYDHRHRLERIRLITHLIDGTPCPRCGRGMYRAQALDLGHADAVVLGGAHGPRRLEHARCNRRHGATLGNRLRGNRRRRQIQTSRLW
jgi:hypothetical protein